MKKVLILVFVMVGVVFANNAQFRLGEYGPKSPQIELAELEAMIASAKEAGKTVDPAWQEQVRQLIPLVKNHPANQNVDGLHAVEFRTLEEDGYGTPVVIRPQELSPLEQQIRDLEFEVDGGASSAQPDETYILSLKEQLRPLYAQRLENQARRNPLDQGAAVCPGTVVSGVPYTDSGTTVGMGNEYFEDSTATCPNFTNGPDVVYAFTPFSSQDYTIDTEGSSYDTYLYVTTGGSCPGITHVACDDDGGTGTLSSITVFMNAGQTYYVFVDGYSTSSGAYVLRIFDNCTVDCQPTDVIECAEVRDSTHAQNNCNGGCENPSFGGVESWQDILPCQSVCGRLFTYIGPNGSNFRDVDAYLFTLTEACSLSVTMRSEVGYSVLVSSGACPWNFVWSTSYAYACSTATFVTPCFQPGTYSIVIVPNAYTGINDFREYRLRLYLIPCSGCRIDAFLQAPGSGGWHTCGAGNDNSLRPSEDYTFCVNIPNDGDWTFSLCNDDSLWDSYIYLSTQCNAGVIASNDDGCSYPLSVIDCQTLAAGNYYLTVEGWQSVHCGPFNLRVFECIGSCCYGDPGAENCAYVSPSFCDSIGGLWTFMEPCSSGACYTRPDCGDGDVMFSQVPSLPDESWNAFRSDYNQNRLLYDNYSVQGPIGSIKFWGVMADDSAVYPCFNPTEDFEITFIDSVNNVQQVYNVTLTPTVLDPIYFGLYNLSEFEATLNPACEITTGYVRVAGTGSPGCDFFWSVPVGGDGILSFETNGSGGGAFQNSFELAFCLDRAPCIVDSVTIISTNNPSLARMDWWQTQGGVVEFWTTTNPNGVFPTDYVDQGNIGFTPGGHNFTDVAGNWDYVNVVLILDCGTPAAATVVNQPSPFFVPVAK